MIPVKIKPEPFDFDDKVRKKGEDFLKVKPHPRSSKEWKGKEYWEAAILDMHDSYNGICAYCAEWIPLTVGDPTVDHYIPKSVVPSKAYEWNNFRLSSLRFNRWKRDYQDVLDPFSIGQNWFYLHFPSLQVAPNPSLQPDISLKVTSTILRLRLNHNLCIRSRKRWIIDLCQGEIPFNYLERNAPFIAQEMIRQGIVSDIKTIMGFD